MTYPLLSLLLCAGVCVFCFAALAPGSEATASPQQTLLIPALVVAYPVTFIWLYFGVALAATLAAELDSRPITLGEGFEAAGRRRGAIARWALVVCTVGLLLRLVGGRLLPAGRISASLAGLSWSLATVFAVPVLAYEGLGPIETLQRSSAVFKSRWGAEVGGDVGIGAVGLLLTIRSS